METATLGGGCFWCTEAIFQRLNGVEKVTSGYSGGDKKTASYSQVSSGTSGHAEVIQIRFDPTVISFEKLLDVFFATHDPTTMNQQGNDVGEQYRSVIFYHSDSQKEASKTAIKKLEDKGKFNDPIVTQVVPFKSFYPAEEDHQNFYNSNPNNSYCQVVIDPKIDKLTKNFKEDLENTH